MKTAAKTIEFTNQMLYGIPIERYFALPGEHITTLRKILISPLAYKDAIDTPIADRDTLRVGRAFHTATLEPDRFPLEYTVYRKEQGIRRGSRWEDFKRVNAARTILTEKQYEQALRMRDAARKHPATRRILEKGRGEVTIQWTHERTGLRFVSRIDWLGDELVDFKGTKDPDPARFRWDAARYGYGVQLASYQRAVHALTGEVPPVKIATQQNVRPYDTVLFGLDAEQLSLGDALFETACDRLVECRGNGRWPGHSDEEVPLQIPSMTASLEDEQIDFGDEQLGTVPAAE